MTVGIYSLYWEEQDLVYVGQSQNINRRFSEHKRLMTNRSHTNYRVQEAYNLYGLPKLIILQQCNIEDCNNLEILWTRELNSLASLNTVEAGQVGYGHNSNASKYSKLQILLVFRLLYLSSDLLYADISKLIGVPVTFIRDINRGNSHLWLRTKYPNSYKKMLDNFPLRNSNSRSRTANPRDSIILISPAGMEYEVRNVAQFCREHELYRNGINRVILKQRPHHCGWILKQCG